MKKRKTKQHRIVLNARKKTKQIKNKKTKRILFWIHHPTERWTCTFCHSSVHTQLLWINIPTISRNHKLPLFFIRIEYKRRTHIIDRIRRMLSTVVKLFFFKFFGSNTISSEKMMKKQNNSFDALRVFCFKWLINKNGIKFKIVFIYYLKTFSLKTWRNYVIRLWQILFKH